MLIEHPHQGDCYDHRNQWMIMDAISQFVASAAWGETRSIQNNVNRGSSWHTTAIIAAESDDLQELRDWAEVQKANGAEWVSFYETWLITEGKFAGKRDTRRLDNHKSTHS